MEGVGARLGRSSTRYGPATVFTGPVRKWKKKWIYVTPPNTPAPSSDKHHHQRHSNRNPSSNCNNNEASHILLYKWTPICKSHSSSADDKSNGDAKDENSAEVDEEPPRRKMKYIPIAVLEEQNELQTDEGKAIENDPLAPAAMSDVPIEENQDCENIHTVGLSLNLNAGDGESEGTQGQDNECS